MSVTSQVIFLQVTPDDQMDHLQPQQPILGDVKPGIQVALLAGYSGEYPCYLANWLHIYTNLVMVLNEEIVL